MSEFLRDSFNESRTLYSGYNETLIELGDENPDVLILYADFAQGQAGPYFKEKYPDRIINMGIAEANLMAVAAGLAEGGKIPFTHCHSIFAVGRAYNQIRQIAFDKYNVKIILCNTGMLWDFMGASHQVIEEIAALRALPNLILLSPSDAIEAKKASKAAAYFDGPVAIRLAEPETPIIYNDDYHFEIGKATLLREGKDVTIAATGILMSKVLQAAKILEREKIDVQILNFHTIKPLDTEAIYKSAQETGVFVTVEDSSIIGGLGGSITEVLSENYPIPIHRIGVKDVFGQTGNMEELATAYNMNINDIIKAVKNVIKKKRK
ncbi:transketolase family protein [[Eubacterium] cellulosolvens]